MKLSALTIAAATSLSSIAYAHPGHDHNAWTAVPLHFIYYGSIAGMIAVAAFGLYQRSKKSKTVRNDHE